MKTQYYTASSLDGFIADPNDSLEWLFPLGDIEDTSYPTFIEDVGALAMGSATYEWILRFITSVPKLTGRSPGHISSRRGCSRRARFQPSTGRTCDSYAAMSDPFTRRW